MQEKRWIFRSESQAGVYRTVRKVGEHLICNCPVYRMGKGYCRHIRLVDNGLPQNFNFEDPEIIQAHVNKPVMIDRRILIPFYDTSSVRMKWWIASCLMEFGVSRKRCEKYFKVKIPKSRILEDKVKGISPTIEGSRFALAGA
jgi:hypothetical protein